MALRSIRVMITPACAGIFATSVRRAAIKTSEDQAKSGGMREEALAAIAFVDLAGFSAITDVFGDAAALAVLDVFEGHVSASLEGGGRRVKWIGDEVMLAFPDPDAALRALGHLLPACRADARLPLTRAGVHYGPVISRGGDYFGATVNIASRITASSSAGRLLATQPIAEVAAAKGVSVEALGPVSLRSVAAKIPLFSIYMAEAVDSAWIDPVCKMHAPYSAYARAGPAGHWFCSPQCEEAFRRSPETYPS
jgi:class 3 adenylate cyclase/YHS domain-containing protein